MSRAATQPRQRVVYVRVTKMYLPRSNPNIARNLFQQIQPGYSGVISPLLPIQMMDMYSSSAILAFRFYDENKSNVTFIITELTQNGEKEACRLCLPISWFPHGYVVHHYFPFITKTPQNGTPFIELDVHVAEVQTPPFSAYYSTLKVIPTWIPPPQMTAGATVLVAAPVNIPEQPIHQAPGSLQHHAKSNQPDPKGKEPTQNENDQSSKLNDKSHHHHTHIPDENSDESEIMLDDLDDVVTEESSNQSPPPVLNSSNTNNKQQKNAQQEIHQPQQLQPKLQQFQPQPQQYQQQPQQFQQQPQQYQQQPQQLQQQAQQSKPQQQHPQQAQYPNSQSNKVQYPPFPPLPSQNNSHQQEEQKPQQNEQVNNADNLDQRKETNEKKKLPNPV